MNENKNVKYYLFKKEISKQVTAHISLVTTEWKQCRSQHGDRHSGFRELHKCPTHVVHIKNSGTHTCTDTIIFFRMRNVKDIVSIVMLLKVMVSITIIYYFHISEPKHLVRL